MQQVNDPVGGGAPVVDPTPGTPTPAPMGDQGGAQVPGAAPDPMQQPPVTPEGGPSMPQVPPAPTGDGSTGGVGGAVQ